MSWLKTSSRNTYIPHPLCQDDAHLLMILLLAPDKAAIIAAPGKRNTVEGLHGRVKHSSQHVREATINLVRWFCCHIFIMNLTVFSWHKFSFSGVALLYLQNLFKYCIGVQKLEELYTLSMFFRNSRSSTLWVLLQPCYLPGILGHVPLCKR